MRWSRQYRPLACHRCHRPAEALEVRLGVRNILIVHRADHGEAEQTAREMESWLRGFSLSPQILAGNSAEVIPLPDLAVVLGGDGTVLGVARQFAGKDVPILGINFGRVGFLTAADANNWRECLTDVLAGKVPIARCLALSWQLCRDGQCLEQGLAINDVVLGRGSIAHLGSYEIKVNDFSLGKIRSDGIIVSSPLGSSGYASSAGGSVIQSEMDAMCITPICPFPGGFSPLVLLASDKISITAKTRSSFLTVDGQYGQALGVGDEILIAAQPEAVLLLGGAGRFYTRLKNRFMALWGQ